MFVKCPHCSKTLKVPDIAAGKKIRCPSCSQAVDVPAASPASSPAPRTSGTSAPPAAGTSAGTSAPGKARKVAGDTQTSPTVAPKKSPSAGSTQSTSAGRPRSVSSSSSETPSGRSTSAGRGSRGSAASSSRRSGGSSASRKPERARREEFVDDYVSGSDGSDDWGGEESDEAYDDYNPFTAPRAGSGSQSRAAGGNADEVAGRRMAGLGLLIQGWATVFIFLTVVGLTGMGMVMDATQTAAPSAAIAGLILLAGIGIFVAGITILVGECMCLSIPARSGAKGLIIAAISCLAGQILLAVIQAVIGSNSARPFGPITPNSGQSAAALVLAVISLGCGLAHLICFELFLKKTSHYVRRDDLAKQATIVLFGFPGCIAFLVVLLVLTPLLTIYVARIFALIALIPMLVAGIAIIVFAVMHVALLFRVGSALRS